LAGCALAALLVDRIGFVAGGACDRHEKAGERRTDTADTQPLEFGVNPLKPT
jgi:hypothetical protein